MSTGDLKNNVEKLQSRLRSIRYDGDINLEGLVLGEPEVFLPLMHFAIMGWNLYLARFIVSQGYDFHNRSDLRFVEGVYRVMRDEFNIRPSLTPFQFLSNGFAERKMLLLCDMIDAARQKAMELEGNKKVKRRRRRRASSLSRPKSSSRNERKDEPKELEEKECDTKKVRWKVIAHKRASSSVNGVDHPKSVGRNGHYSMTTDVSKKPSEAEEAMAALQKQLSDALSRNKEYEKVIERQQQQLHDQQAEIMELRKMCADLESQRRQQEQERMSMVNAAQQKDPEPDSIVKNLDFTSADDIPSRLESKTGTAGDTFLRIAQHENEDTSPIDDYEPLHDSLVESSSIIEGYQEQIDQSQGSVNDDRLYTAENSDGELSDESMREFIAKMTASLQQSKDMLISRGYSSVI